MARSSTRVRGAWILGIVATVAIGLVVSPVGAAFNPTKAKIRKIAAKQVAKVGDQRFLQQTKVVIVEDSVTAPNEETTDALCPVGHEALGGGYQTANDAADVNVTWSEPIVNGDNLTAEGAGTHPAATGWRVAVDGLSGTNTYAVAVICAPAA